MTRRYSWPAEYRYLSSNKTLRVALGLRGLLEKDYMTPELEAFKNAIDQVVEKYSKHGTILLRGDQNFGYEIHRDFLSAALDVLLQHGRTIWPKREGEADADTHPKWLYRAGPKAGEAESVGYVSNLIYNSPTDGINEDYVCIEPRFLNLVLEQCIKKSYRLNGNGEQQRMALRDTPNASAMQSGKRSDKANDGAVAPGMIGRTRSSTLRLRTSTQRATRATSPEVQAESGPASETEEGAVTPVEIDEEDLLELRLRLAHVKMMISNQQIEGVIGLRDCETAETLFATATRWLGAPVQAMVVHFSDRSLHQLDVMIEDGSEAQDAWDIVLEVLTQLPVQECWLIGQIRR